MVPLFKLEVMKYFILAVMFLFIGGGGAYFFYSSQQTEKTAERKETPKVEDIKDSSVSEREDLILVQSPTPNSVVDSPVTVRGEARGFWFFEATAPVLVVDWDGRIIGESYIEAQDNWMTEELVPFEGQLTFELPENSYSASGTIIFRRANASGLPEHDMAIEIPVTFAPD